MYFEEHHKTLEGISFFQGTDSILHESKDKYNQINESRDNIEGLNQKERKKPNKFANYLKSKEEKRSTQSNKLNTSNMRQNRFSSQASNSNINENIDEDSRIAPVE